MNNQRVAFIPSIIWGTDPTYGGLPVGIYLEQSTDPGDPWYKKQNGPFPKCDQSGMAQIAAVLLAHEQRHWTFAHGTLAGLDLVRTLDSAKVLPGQSTDPANAMWAKLNKAWADSITSANTATHAVMDNYPNCQVTR